MPIALGSSEIMSQVRVALIIELHAFILLFEVGSYNKITVIKLQVSNKLLFH